MVVLRCRVDWWGRSDRVLLRTPDELSAAPEERAREAVGHVAASLRKVGSGADLSWTV
jgi:hypothetical protein